MGLMDKRAADWTARDAVNVWSSTWILDLLKILFVFPLFFRPQRKRRTLEEIRQAQIDSEGQR